MQAVNRHLNQLHPLSHCRLFKLRKNNTLQENLQGNEKVFQAVEINSPHHETKKSYFCTRFCKIPSSKERWMYLCGSVGCCKLGQKLARSDDSWQLAMVLSYTSGLISNPSHTDYVSPFFCVPFQCRRPCCLNKQVRPLAGSLTQKSHC